MVRYLIRPHGEEARAAMRRTPSRTTRAAHQYPPHPLMPHVKHFARGNRCSTSEIETPHFARSRRLGSFCGRYRNAGYFDLHRAQVVAGREKESLPVVAAEADVGGLRMAVNNAAE